MQKKCKKIWSYQKKAVLLHPLFKGTYEIPPSGGMLVKRYSDRRA